MFSFLLFSMGCTPHATDSTEVGVRVAKVGILGSRGVVDNVYAPGATYFFPPMINDWFTFDTALQNLAMTRDKGTGDRAGDDSLYFKTIDGNDVSVDVTVAWSIDATKVQHLVQFVGIDTTTVGDSLVRPVARTVVRDVLNELKSEEYYDAQARFEKAETAATLLNERLNPEGVKIAQVLLGEHKFNNRYEQIIRDKKVAEQDASRLTSETEAAREQMRRELEVAKGAVSKSIEAARGAAQQKQISADAIYFEREKQAEAILSERQAKAKGIAERAKALAGSGGRSLVKLEVAKALVGKPIVFIPAGGGSDLRTTNMNDLLETYGALAVADGGADAPKAKSK